MALFGFKKFSDSVTYIFQKFNLLGSYQHFQRRSIFHSQQVSYKRVMTSKRHNITTRSQWFKRLMLSGSEEYVPNQIVHYLATRLNMPFNSVLYSFIKYPERKRLKLGRVKSSLAFLKTIGFSNKVIAESVQICFYDREHIKRGFQKIAENKVELRKYGFYNGHIRDRTKNFSKGTIYRDKRLQLCLYYMELPYEFNGYGCFSNGH